MRTRRVPIAAMITAAALIFGACNSGTVTNVPSPPASSAAQASAAGAPSSAASAAAGSPAASANLTGTLRIGANGWILSKFPVQKAAQDFMARHPGVKVTVFANDQTDFVQKYLLDWTAGHTDVDLAIGGTEGQLAPLAAKGLLVNWDNFFTGQFTKDKFIAPLLQLGMFGGHQMTLPFMGEVMMFSINKPMFQKAGLLDSSGQAIPPKTWDDLVTYGQKLTAANGGNPGLSIHWGFSFATYNYFTCLLGEQGTIYGSDGKTVDFESPAAHDCLNVGRQLIAKNYSMKGTTSNDDAGRTAYKAGQVAAILEAASREAEAAATLGASKVGVMFAPGTQQHGTIVFSHAVFIPKISPSVALAQEFVREEILTPAFEQSGLTNFGKLPILQSAYAGLNDPTIQLELNAVSHGVNAPRYRDYNQLDTEMQQQIQKAVLGQESVDQALTNLHNYIRTLDLTNVAAAP